MPEPQDNAQVTTQAKADGADVKPGAQATLLASGNPNPQGTPPADAGAADKGKPDADAQAKADAAKPAQVPERYDFKMPEGITLDAEGTESLTKVARELGLSQEQAQKVADLGAIHTQRLQKAFADSQVKAWDEARGKWVESIQADKEVGGAKFNESKELALRAVSKFADKELMDLFSAGWGDNPALFRAFVKIGKALGEDRAIDGTKSTSDKSAEEVLYPGQVK